MEYAFVYDMMGEIKIDEKRYECLIKACDEFNKFVNDHGKHPNKKTPYSAQFTTGAFGFDLYIVQNPKLFLKEINEIDEYRKICISQKYLDNVRNEYHKIKIDYNDKIDYSFGFIVKDKDNIELKQKYNTFDDVKKLFIPEIELTKIGKIMQRTRFYAEVFSVKDKDNNQNENENKDNNDNDDDNNDDNDDDDEDDDDDDDDDDDGDDDDDDDDGKIYKIYECAIIMNPDLFQKEINQIKNDIKNDYKYDYINEIFKRYVRFIHNISPINLFGTNFIES